MSKITGPVKVNENATFNQRQFSGSYATRSVVIGSEYNQKSTTPSLGETVFTVGPRNEPTSSDALYQELFT